MNSNQAAQHLQTDNVVEEIVFQLSSEEVQMIAGGTAITNSI